MLNLPILNVRIQPCSVGEQHLTPQAQGHHCALCNQLVQDFTHSSQAKLEQARAASPDGRVCGRFTSEQLVPAVRLRPKLRRFLVALVLVCGLGITYSEVWAQINRLPGTAYPPYITIPPKEEGDPYSPFRCEKLPLYKGVNKKDDVTKFIARNTQWPAGAERICMDGRVFVYFLVDEEGRVRNAKITKGLHPLFDAEALRVIQLLDRQFEPALCGGKPASVSFTVPVSFRIE
ncbi:energy transducer TonB [Hymenobacter sp. HD11105]